MTYGLYSAAAVPLLYMPFQAWHQQHLCETAMAVAQLVFLGEDDEDDNEDEIVGEEQSGSPGGGRQVREGERDRQAIYDKDLGSGAAFSIQIRRHDVPAEQMLTWILLLCIYISREEKVEG